ncbi:NUDIX hydrolase [Rhodothermus profundi]|uniref:NUDIX hydrolase n=1 Tax=Rhodothermus profundi TaxID=633813 RepID=UPI001FEB6114|nr:NUDIX hydrolase [Rhodothermus profundi]
MSDTAPQVFVVCLASASLPEVLPEGIRLWETPEQASACCLDGQLWVIEVPPGAASFDGEGWRLRQPLPASAIRNRTPYRPPVTVPAAGGVVQRRRETPEVLLIHRRGCWDLPKGKCEPGETPEACALREVSEELGVTPVTLRLRAPLGRTVHAYPLDGYYAVKPTWWFLMETTAVTFTPQETEAIQEVRWFPLEEALRRVTYPTLQALLERLRSYT